MRRVWRTEHPPKRRAGREHGGGLNTSESLLKFYHDARLSTWAMMLFGFVRLGFACRRAART